MKTKENLIHATTAKVFKAILPPHYRSIGLILILEAYCDLALLNIPLILSTSEFSRGGIEDIAPTEIRTSEMEKLLLFMEEEDKNTVESHYEIKDRIIDGESVSVYVQKEVDDDTVEELNSIFEVPMLLVNAIENGINAQNSEGEAEESQNLAIFQEMIPRRRRR